MKTAAKIMSVPLTWAVLGASAALAQTSTTTMGTTTTPGVPNTGAGGDLLTNVLLLGISAAAVVAGIVYLVRMRATPAE